MFFFYDIMFLQYTEIELLESHATYRSTGSLMYIGTIHPGPDDTRSCIFVAPMLIDTSRLHLLIP
jgi:hypothetical protein